MDSKQDFFNVIYDYYYKRVDAAIPSELLREVSERITDFYYEQYSIFRLQYPKSVKRYSSFKIDDLNHPQVFEIVIKYFKEKLSDDYSDYSSIVLELNSDELKAFEKSRQQFYCGY
ncbi:hypothetical protein [Hymenobacter sp. UYCo722]|uniref:hypothetical protein n=1 Tax=Hymenobacter sp. UYCo722 TaxID=3156335 RepID=UPI0033949B9B